MTQSVIQIGNSLGITIPADFAKRHGLKKGSRLSVVASDGQLSLSTKIPSATKYRVTTDRELAAAVQEVEAQYGTALDKLATLQ